MLRSARGKKTSGQIADWWSTMLKKWRFSRREGTVDSSKWLGQAQPTTKQRLIEKCHKYGVSVCVDDASETSAGIYADFRGVASEAELERRLSTSMQLRELIRANQIRFFAYVSSFIVAVLALAF